MYYYSADVAYKATIVERQVLRAKNREEAIQKIKDDDIDDCLDDYVEKEELIDIDIYQEDEIDG